MRCRTILDWSLSALLVGALTASSASGQQLKSTLVGSGFARPVFVTSPPGDTQRLFVIEQFSGTTGRIRIIKNGSVLPTAYLSVTVTNGNEQGLLGLAFHPDFANNGRFFIGATVTGGGAAGSNVVREYRALGGDPNSDVADPAVVATLLTVNDPQSNHNGGCLQFGPDGYLYFGLGDGGSANDQGTGHAAGGNAQSLTTYLGKMIRFDVENAPSYVPASNPFASPVDGVLDLIWSYGVRNPWRFSFDRLTGDMYIGDVGQNAWEEISFQPASSAGGENYLWRCMEGNHCTGLSGCTCPGSDPQVIQEYSHSGGNCSITGGYVYRGSAIPSLQGTYFYADYCSSNIWSFQYSGSGPITNLVNRTAQLDPAGALSIGNVTSFGEDANGELYICDQAGGEVYRIEEVCAVPSTYCVTSPNSVGPGAVMGSNGTGQISLNNLVLTTVGCPPTVNGLYFFGSGQTQVPMGNGFRCIASSLIRLPVVTTDFLGDASFNFDFNAGYAAGLVPGTTKNFQFWYRDVQGGGALFNVSDALAVPICQ